MMTSLRDLIYSAPLWSWLMLGTALLTLILIVAVKKNRKSKKIFGKPSFWEKRRRHIFGLALMGTIAVLIFFLAQNKTVQEIYSVALTVLAATAGLVVGVLIAFLISPLFKHRLLNHPQHPQDFALFTEVVPGHAKLKMRGGRHIGTIRNTVDNNGKPLREDAANSLWYLFQLYIYHVTGLHVIGVPYFQTIYTYQLPRYRVVERQGRRLYIAVESDDVGYRSDHVRNESTTWHFELAEAEIATIPVRIQGSVQIMIKQGGEHYALFRSDSWNVLLDQALRSVTRSIVLSDVSLDKVLGTTEKDIWEDPAKTDPDLEDVHDELQEKILKGLRSFRIGKKDEEDAPTLKDHLWLIVQRVDISDVKPVVSKEEAEKIRSALIARQQARGRVFEGQGEAEYLAEQIKVIKDGGEHSLAVLQATTQVNTAKAAGANAVVFVGNSSGNIDPANATLLQKGIQK